MQLIRIILPVLFLSTITGTTRSLVLTSVSSGKADDPVKIGMLVTDNHSVAAIRGAELAVKTANDQGGLKGKPFKLIVRSMEGPWGTGSKQAIDLIFNEKVCALIGSHDGRNAHLVEQAAVKTRIVFLSAWTGDPTLSQAFVPWYFSCVPNDLQQADILVDEIYNKRSCSQVVLFSSNDYDSDLAAKSFIRKAESSGKISPRHFVLDPDGRNIPALIEMLIKEDPQALVLFCNPSESMMINRQLRSQKYKSPVYGSMSLLNEDNFKIHDLANYENMIIVSAGPSENYRSEMFREKFTRLYNEEPGCVAASSFDGASMLIEAIRKAGQDRLEIQKALVKMKYDGVTGEIRFDDKGNRIGKPVLSRIMGGKQTVKK